MVHRADDLLLIAPTPKFLRSAASTAEPWLSMVQVEMSFITAAVPGPFDTLLYSTVSAPGNEVSVFAGRGLLADFGPETTALEGTILLTYGAFTDPQSVEVLVEEVDLTFPSLELAGVERHSCDEPCCPTRLVAGLDRRNEPARTVRRRGVGGEDGGTAKRDKGERARAAQNWYPARNSAH